MEQAQNGKAGPLPVDKRSKEYKATLTNSDASPQKVTVGWVHLHAPLFFARKNFKEKVDVRTDKSPDGKLLTMEYDRTEKELVVRCGDYEQFIPVTNIRGYEAIATTKKIPAIQPTSNVGANPKITAQVSGPHDHVFAGQGAGQTGQAKIK